MNEADIPSDTPIKETGERLPSIRDVARLAKVSPGTVSMSLSNDSRVSKETRLAVVEAAKALNYKMRQVGRPTLKEGSKKKLAPDFKTIRKRIRKIAILMDSSDAHLQSNIYTEAFKGAEEVFSEAKVDIAIMQANTNHLSRDIEGCLFLGEQVDRMMSINRGLPSVRMMGLIKPNFPLDHITYNNRHIGALAAQHCQNNGARRVGILSFHRDLFSDRCNDLMKCLQEMNIPFVASAPHEHDEYYRNYGVLEHVLKQMFTPPQAPDVIFSCADLITATLYPLLYSMGIQPGKDVQIITCNNEPQQLLHLRPMPQVIDLQAKAIGNIAAFQLLKRIQHPSHPPVHVQVEPFLVAISTA